MLLAAVWGVGMLGLALFGFAADSAPRGPRLVKSPVSLEKLYLDGRQAVPYHSSKMKADRPRPVLP